MENSFKLTEEHIRLIRRLNFKTIVYNIENIFHTEEDHIRPNIDQKRPFGNSDVIGDVLSELGEKADEEGNWSPEQITKAKQILIEIPAALRVILDHETFKPGVYSISRYGYFNYLFRKNYLALEPALFEMRHWYMGENVENYKKYYEFLDTSAQNIVEDDPWVLLKELKRLADTENEEAAVFFRKAYNIFSKYKRMARQRATT